MNNGNDNDDWFTAQPRESGEAAATPPLSVVPEAADDDDWFSAVGFTGAASEVVPSPASGGETSSVADVPGDTGGPLDVDDDWVTVSVPSAPLPQKAFPPPPPRGVEGAGDGPSWWRRHRSGLAVGGSCGVLALVVGVGVAAVAGSASSSSDASPITELVSAPSTSTSVSVTVEPVVDQPWCAGRADGVPIAVDATDPGEAAIARFQHAYYIDRDGHRARAVVAPDARVGSAESINAGIAQIPPGTEHCVLAKKISDGVYAVDLFERRPDTTGEHYRQTITTTPDGALITAITTREEA